MTIAFYAPLKAPTHPTPSGDRSMARALIRAVECTGQKVALASDLRLYDGRGDATRQAEITAAAETEITRLCALPQAREWTHWLTYHNYYKAPDLIGPHVSATLGIPYHQVESTRAKRRLDGPWAGFAAAAEAASDAAQTIFYFTHHDAETLRRDAVSGQRLVHLPPFLPRDDLPAPSDLSGPMLSVAMMRAGDKLASYTLMAEALALVGNDVPWRLDIIGDGAVRAQVSALMEPFGARVRLLGEMKPDALRAYYASARALLWPGVNEAFGMVYLEAQAAGLPVIAQDRPGVRDVVAGTHPPVADGPKALAARIATLTADADTAKAEANAARAKIAQSHLLPQAARILNTALETAT